MNERYRRTDTKMGWDVDGGWREGSGLGGRAAFPEEPNSASSTRVLQLAATCNSSPRGGSSSSACPTPYVWAHRNKNIFQIKGERLENQHERRDSRYSKIKLLSLVVLLKQSARQPTIGYPVFYLKTRLITYSYLMRLAPLHPMLGIPRVKLMISGSGVSFTEGS